MDFTTGPFAGEEWRNLPKPANGGSSLMERLQNILAGCCGCDTSRLTGETEPLREGSKLTVVKL